MWCWTQESSPEPTVAFAAFRYINLKPWFWPSSCSFSTEIQELMRGQSNSWYISEAGLGPTDISGVLAFFWNTGLHLLSSARLGRPLSLILEHTLLQKRCMVGTSDSVFSRRKLSSQPEVPGSGSSPHGGTFIPLDGSPHSLKFSFSC